MAQYISKDAIVAEIKRRRKLVSDPILSGNDLMIGERNALFNLLQFIDTLEVKEVDLDREIRRYRMRNPIIQHREESLYDYMANVAKHFFELGLKVNQKGE